MTEYVEISEHRPSPYHGEGWVEVWGKRADGTLRCVGQSRVETAPAIGRKVQL